MTSYDTVILGSSANALTAAAYLAWLLMSGRTRAATYE